MSRDIPHQALIIGLRVRQSFGLVAPSTMKLTPWPIFVALLLVVYIGDISLTIGVVTSRIAFAKAILDKLAGQLLLRPVFCQVTVLARILATRYERDLLFLGRVRVGIVV